MGRDLFSEANFSVFTGLLVAISGCLSKAVEMTFLDLPSAVERSERVSQAHDTKPVGVAVQFRFSIAPSLVTPDTLVHHRFFPVFARAPTLPGSRKWSEPVQALNGPSVNFPGKSVLHAIPGSKQILFLIGIPQLKVK